MASDPSEEAPRIPVVDPASVGVGDGGRITLTIAGVAVGIATTAVVAPIEAKTLSVGLGWSLIWEMRWWRPP